MKRAEHTSLALVTLKGMSAANIWIVLPGLASIPIMWCFGEGAYIVPVMGVMWCFCAYFGLRMRRRAESGSVKRSIGFWVCLWSIVLALTMLALTTAIVADGAPFWGVKDSGVGSEGERNGLACNLTANAIRMM